MATQAIPASWTYCPNCGRNMTAVEVPIATPPFVVLLVGCETCGVTTNEMTAPAPEDCRDD
jgi:C4-type Zn-finger protein